MNLPWSRLGYARGFPVDRGINPGEGSCSTCCETTKHAQKCLVPLRQELVARDVTGYHVSWVAQLLIGGVLRVTFDNFEAIAWGVCSDRVVNGRCEWTPRDHHPNMIEAGLRRWPAAVREKALSGYGIPDLRTKTLLVECGSFPAVKFFRAAFLGWSQLVHIPRGGEVLYRFKLRGAVRGMREFITRLPRHQQRRFWDYDFPTVR